MRLQNQRNALDCGRVRTFPTLTQSLLYQNFRIREQRNPLAGGALAAKVIGQAFAISRLREHAS